MKYNRAYTLSKKGIYTGVDKYINELELSYTYDTYYSIPDGIKGRQDFKKKFNKLKLKNGKLQGYDPIDINGRDPVCDDYDMIGWQDVTTDALVSEWDTFSINQKFAIVNNLSDLISFRETWLRNPNKILEMEISDYDDISKTVNNEYDWRNYASYELKRLWCKLNDTQKRVTAECFQNLANVVREFERKHGTILDT